MAKKKFTEAELEAFKKAKESIQSLETKYEGKKAKENDTRIIAMDQLYKSDSWKKSVTVSNKKKASDPNIAKKISESMTPDVKRKKSQSLRKTLATSESKTKKSIASKKMWEIAERKLKTQKCVLTPFGVFDSNLSASRHWGITPGAFANVLRRNKDNPEYKHISYEEYLDLKNKIATIPVHKNSSGVEKYITTPIGTFFGISKAVTETGYSATKLRRLIKNNPTEYYYITKEEYEQLKGLQ
jgi:hypothetical protein